MYILLRYLFVIFAILLSIFASIGEGILGLDGDTTLLDASIKSGFGLNKLVQNMNKNGGLPSFKSAMESSEDQTTTQKSPKRKNNSKPKKGEKGEMEKESKSEDSASGSASEEETSLEDAISTSESVPSSTSKMDTTTSTTTDGTTTPITTTDSRPPSDMTEQSSTTKFKKRRKSKSRRKFGSTTDASSDNTTSSIEYSDEDDTQLSTSTQPSSSSIASTSTPTTTTPTVNTSETSSTITTITSAPPLSVSSTTTFSEVSTIESTPSDATTSTTTTLTNVVSQAPSTTEDAPQTSSTTDVGPVNTTNTSTISPSTAPTTTFTTITSVVTTEPTESTSTTSTTETPISSLSSPQIFNSSQLESTTKKPSSENVTQVKPKIGVMSDRSLSQPGTKMPKQKEEEDVTQTESSDTEQLDDKASLQCVATAPRLNLNLDMMLGEWYPARLSEITSKLWSQSLEKEKNKSVAGCFLMDYSMPKDDPDTLQITLSRRQESAKVEALFVGDDHHPKESKWAITWPNGEDTLTSVVAAGVILGGKGKEVEGKRGNRSSRYAWLLTVDCDLNGIVEPDWAVMARVREGISNATLSTILAIVEGLKGLTVDDAITFQSDDCHKNNNNNNTNKK